MNDSTDRNTINTDNYQFYFKKLLSSKYIKIQIDVLNKETVRANGLRLVSTVSVNMSTFFMIYNYMNPETVKTACLVAAGASIKLNRTSTLFSHGYGDDDNDMDKDEEVGVLATQISRLLVIQISISLIEKIKLAKDGLHARMNK